LARPHAPSLQTSFVNAGGKAIETAVIAAWSADVA
jgi:hypothetical protein